MDKIGGIASHLMDEEKGRDNIPRKGRKESPIVSGIKEERKKPACLVVKQAGVPIDRVIRLSKKRILIDQTWLMRRPCGLEKPLVKLSSIGHRGQILYYYFFLNYANSGEIFCENRRILSDLMDKIGGMASRGRDVIKVAHGCGGGIRWRFDGWRRRRSGQNLLHNGRNRLRV